MLTMTCTIKFSDGKELAGTVIADSPQGSYPVRYEGETDRWPTRIDRTRPATLQALFKDFAALTKSEFNLTTAGDYEIWAE